ncbi:MAG: acylphosphatase [Candidatus Diapherotrites archaeon]|uniref:acylphosphatase n=1 Tax=Candidatus Iainarchaeum sp. TaxID=3101447 RepID=A0A8T4KU83_9ARCH|nr:acylphosphatase [Candidatus Diapherotrites archaeon]
MQLIRATLIVSGRVRKVGYRLIVEEKALGLGVKGTVENMPDGRVRIVCEGEKEKIDEFINAINLKERLINVQNIDKKIDKATGKFKEFRIISENDMKELRESTDAGAMYLRVLVEDTNNNFNSLDKKYGSISEKMDKFAEVISEIIKTLREDRAEIIETLKEDRAEMKGIAGAMVEAIKSFKAG